MFIDQQIGEGFSNGRTKRAMTELSMRPARTYVREGKGKTIGGKKPVAKLKGNLDLRPENMGFVLNLRGRRRKCIRKNEQSALKKESVKRSPQKLSGPGKQRVAAGSSKIRWLRHT